MDEKKEKLSIQEVKRKGGLDFPLDIEDISVLKQSFLASVQIQLVNGIATIYDTNILASSIGVATHYNFSGTVGVLSVQCGNGFANIISSSNADNSIVNVIIIY